MTMYVRKTLISYSIVLFFSRDSVNKGAKISRSRPLNVRKSASLLYLYTIINTTSVLTSALRTFVRYSYALLLSDQLCFFFLTDNETSWKLDSQLNHH